MRLVSLRAASALATLSWSVTLGCGKIVGIEPIAYVAADAAAADDATDAAFQDAVQVDTTQPDTTRADTSDAAPDAPSCDPVVTASDNRNCGRCGHDCMGTECKLGVCQPVFLLTSLTHPTSLATSEDDYVYWVDDVAGTVSRARKAVPSAEEILVNTSLPAIDLVVDKQYVYYTAYSEPPMALGGVNRVPKDNSGGVVKLSGGLTGTRKLAMNDGYVFYGAGDEPMDLVRTSKDTPGYDVVMPGVIHDSGAGTNLLAFAADNQYAFTTDISINVALRVPQDPGSGEPSVTLSRTEDRPIALAVDSDFVFWGDNHYLYRTPKMSPTPVPDILVKAWITAIAVDASDVYFVSNEILAIGTNRGAINRVSRVGFGRPQEVSGGWGVIEGMAIDRSFVYFTTAGKILKVAK
jgi:hypothetical protein